jgi:hypothetical protein
MAFGQDTGGAVLAYVTRVVTGDIFTDVSSFNNDTMKNETIKVAVENPVIVFFPNKTCQVLPMKVAERMGFLEQPVILNFESVDRPDTTAGRFKFAMSEEVRRQQWVLMEQDLISACMSRGGHPIPLDARISQNSLFIKEPTKRKEVA